MLTIERIRSDGQFLFRWRSYFPLVLLPVLLTAIPDGVRMEQLIGEAWSDLWTAGCVLLAFIGVTVRAATVGFVPFGTSGRNTTEQRADHLNTSGLYSVVRNPLYVGNFIGFIALIAATKVWWLIILASLAYWLYVERIIAAEEAYLQAKHGRTYLDWASRTPAFIPEFKKWRAPELRFSIRTVLRREYNGVALIAMSFCGLDALQDLVFEGQSTAAWLREDRRFIILFLASLLLCVLLRWLKKNSSLLHEEGR